MAEETPTSVVTLGSLAKNATTWKLNNDADVSVVVLDIFLTEL